MKKIIALALALIMALSMASVAFAADHSVTVADAPGDEIVLIMGDPSLEPNARKREWKISYDFTSAKDDYKGASLISSIAWEKDNDLVLTLKENLTSTTAKDIAGLVTLTSKTSYTLDANNKKVYDTYTIAVAGSVNNGLEYIDGAKKADEADVITNLMDKNVVLFAEDAGGYVTFADGDSLTGTVKVEKDEKAQVYFADYETDVAEDTQDAIDAYLGEDFDGIVEYIVLEGTGFKNEVDFQYDAYEEDPHFFYVWDGEKFVDLEAKYDDDEDVDNYVFTADAKGIILVSDVELVAAAEEETKNPDTGANDVVGVAAALAVVSLVAAGAVSLKK